MLIHIQTLRMDEKSPLPAEIRAARDRAGLTQAQAAKLAGYGQPSRWNEIESGAREIDIVRWRYWLHVSGVERLPFRRAR